MLNLRLTKYIVNKNNIFTRFSRNKSLFSTSKHSSPLKTKRYIYGSLVTAGLLSCGTWCYCEDLRGLQGSDGKKTWRKWMEEKYDDNIVHSSTLRFGRAGYAVVRVFVDYKYTLSGLDWGSDEYKKQKSACHLRSAIRLRDLCSSNGGVFMKIGQHIGCLDFVFPKEYTETLRCFQYSAPESPLEDVHYVIETDTKHSMNELFDSFEEKPIGSASLAQVHSAVLKNGEKVAVKVQHKTVKQHAFEDVKVIEFFVNVATRLFPEFQFQWLVDQIKQNLPLELDFLNEGVNCEKMERYLEKFKNISVPKILWKSSTQRVLFMEYINGGIVDDLDYIEKNKLNVNEISTELGRLYSEMIFVRGDIHCDPHPGNILVRKSKKGNNTEVVLLDHGLYVKMKDEVRLNYCRLWQSMIECDIEGVKKHGESLGVGKYSDLFACMVSGRTWTSIQSGITEKSISTEELAELHTEAVKYVSVITEILNVMPRELVLVFKTNDLLRGLDSRLKTRATSGSFITMSKCCLRAIYEEEYSKCDSFASRWRLYSRLKWNELRLSLYQLSLLSPKLLLTDVVSLFLEKLNNMPKFRFLGVT